MIYKYIYQKEEKELDFEADKSMESTAQIRNESFCETLGSLGHIKYQDQEYVFLK